MSKKEITFEEYLEKTREDVKRKPKNDLERGFQTAIVIVYERYKRLKK